MERFGTSVNRPLYGRAPSPGLRFILLAIVCLVVMYLDQRGRWAERLRYGLQAMAYPVQVAVNSPAAAWRWMNSSFESRAALRADNAALHAQLRTLALADLRLQALEVENASLRALKQAPLPLVGATHLAEVIAVDSSALRQRLILNRGARDGAHAGQAVVDASGILGQIVRVGPYSAELILITDPESAIPLQVLRNGLRTIAIGADSGTELLLPFMAVNSDIRSGDVLVSSGLGGVYPAGMPVARVTGVYREANQLVAQVHAQPFASISTAREVVLLDFNPEHPAAPARTPPIEPAPVVTPHTGTPKPGGEDE